MTNYQTEIKIKVPLDVAETYWNATEEDRQKIAEKIAFYVQSSNLSRKLESSYLNGEVGSFRFGESIAGRP